MASNVYNRPRIGVVLLVVIIMMITSVRSDVIHAFPNPPPTAIINLYPQTVHVGGMVYLDGTSSQDGWGITNYNWTIIGGDQETHMYSDKWQYVFHVAGFYLITLNVTSRSSQTDETSVVVNVTSDPFNNPPVADAGWDVYGDTSPYTSWGFNGYGSMDDFGISTYEWTFFDGSIPVILYGPNPGYGFANAGTFIVTLTVADSEGLTDNDTTTAYIQSAAPPVAEAGPDQNVDVGDVVVFDGSGSTDDVGIVSYTWTLFDGELINLWGLTTEHTFQIPGDYVVSLNVKDAAYNEDEDTLTVHVLGSANTPPIADAGANVTIEPGTTFRFNASGSIDDAPGLQYLWTFMYNSSYKIMYGASPQFRFDIPGSYVVNLVVTDAKGLTDTDTIVVYVRHDSSNGPARMMGLVLVVGGIVTGIAIVAGTHLVERRGKKKA